MREIQLPPEVSDEPSETIARKPPSPVLKLASAPEVRSQRDIEVIARLQKEVAILQAELEKARNEITRYEALLRNAKQRELELRADLVPKGKVNDRK